MATQILERAAQDPVLRQQLADALRAVLGVDTPKTLEDVQTLVAKANRDRAFRATLAAAVGQVAARHGLAFEPQASVQLSDAALASVVGGATPMFQKDNPTQIPIDSPIALVFIGAALIFLPLIFNISGQTSSADGK